MVNIDERLIALYKDFNVAEMARALSSAKGLSEADKRLIARAARGESLSDWQRWRISWLLHEQQQLRRAALELDFWLQEGALRELPVPRWSRLRCLLSYVKFLYDGRELREGS